MAKKYALTETQIRHLAIICYREQGNNDAGVRACASHMCNYYEKWQSRRFSNLYECVFGSGWYWTRTKNETWVYEHPGVPQAVIDAVQDVIANGNRTLPEYVDEYDCLSDVKTAFNNGISFDPRDRTKYIKDVTKITNVYGSSYTFYCFPDGAGGSCDAFGYILKPEEVINMTAAEKATRWMEDLADDPCHGYDQIYRWGEKGDYDCSSAVIKAWEQAGVPVKSKGGATYTGNMYAAFKKCGFKDVTAKINLTTGDGLQRSDVLLNHIHHVAMYCGSGLEVEASINEKGTAKGGTPGDQTGREILRRAYRNYPWNAVLRYEAADEKLVDEITIEEPDILTPSPETTTGGENYMFTTETVKNGSSGASAKLLQKLLRGEGFYGANGKALTIDGQAGTNTIFALRSYQRSNGLTADGICGPLTWKSIIGI